MRVQTGGKLREAFGKPLVVIAPPTDNVAPPLVRYLVRSHFLKELLQPRAFIQPQLVAGGGVEKRRVRHEDQAGPTLPEYAGGLLRYREVLVRNGAEVSGEQVQCIHRFERGLIHYTHRVEPAWRDAYLRFKCRV